MADGEVVSVLRKQTKQKGDESPASIPYKHVVTSLDIPCLCSGNRGVGMGNRGLVGVRGDKNKDDREETAGSCFLLSVSFWVSH